jgi:adenosylcobinamide-phosphate synthase
VVNRALAVAAGLAADTVFGEPPLRPHPVAALGGALQRIESSLYRDRRVNGVVHAALGVGLGTVAGATVHSTAIATYLAVAGRALRDAAADVDRALISGDLERARLLLPALVGRDPSKLDEKDICRAVVESVAENTVDAVVAPAWWALVAGAQGVVAHRAVNTMDAMVGHRDNRYGEYGWAAARLDDVAAWLPARMTVALVCAARPRSAGRVARIVRCDAAAHPSPNGGVAEAAFAAALDLRLGGLNSYCERTELRPGLGDGRPPDRRDIARANRLSRDVTLVLIGALAGLGVARSVRRR